MSGFRLVLFTGLLLYTAGFAKSQTAADAAKLPEAKQREAIAVFVNTAVANLSSKNDTSGKPKTPAQYEVERPMANLVRALFTADPRHPEGDPTGYKIVLARIKKASVANPSKTVLEITGELVDWSYKHFYTDFYNVEKKADYAKKNDDEQTEYFRLNIQMFQNERAHTRMIKELQDADAKLLKRIQEMYDTAVILADGRHVLPAKNGDFMVITADPEDKSEVKLEYQFKAEAQRIYDCKNARGIKNGLEARAACAGSSR